MQTRERVVILQHLILPIISYSASVFHVPQTGFQDQVNSLHERYINRSKSKRALPKSWWYLPPGQGRLGLTPISSMLQSLQLQMLCKVIRSSRHPPNQVTPSWAEPIIPLFDQAVSPWGRDYDILYAPVSTSPDYAEQAAACTRSSTNSLELALPASNQSQPGFEKRRKKPIRCRKNSSNCVLKYPSSH
ncbi:hypothetical protein PsorP6_011255 [Peronosclerospora sorghi]|uniref:Uncharacterized protein n=1 Tax=Peronosclerospora sorghi TaxID=230839 RepID=A0ACC0WMD0_9STRA|nr:hypothetical protein PsorP6_011255 [Peronosclerospora sorghi]